MIASGLNWRLAIGALVLGNAIMGAVITINGRIGARVSTRRYHATITMLKLTLFSSTLHSQSSLAYLLDTTPATSLWHLDAHLLSSGLGEIHIYEIYKQSAC
jgi:hypothetical protein